MDSVVLFISILAAFIIIATISIIFISIGRLIESSGKDTKAYSKPKTKLEEKY